jgi:hypothetical protein
VVKEVIDPGWHGQGPLGASAIGLRASLVRLLWCAIQPERGLAGMPEGWFRGQFLEQTTIPWPQTGRVDFEAPGTGLKALFAGFPDGFAAWIRERTSRQNHPFDLAVREADLETVSKFAKRRHLAESQPDARLEQVIHGRRELFLWSL